MSNPAIIETAPAKINLTLDVLGKRRDGFHEVKMLMQTIDLSDTVELSPGDDQLYLSMSGPALPEGEENIAARAARALARAARRPPAASIRITKRIPMAAGLAGGSADAAAVLRGLNRLWGLDWPLSDLEPIAASLGSDVVFCLYGGCALATGRGEKLLRLPDSPPVPIVLVCPDVKVSTASIYACFDQAKVRERPDTELAIKALANGDTAILGKCLCNVLETVTLEKYPRVRQIKDLLGALGAPCLMSGSGPSVFALAGPRVAARLEDIKDLRVWASSTGGTL